MRHKALSEKWNYPQKALLQKWAVGSILKIMAFHAAVCICGRGRTERSEADPEADFWKETAEAYRTDTDIGGEASETEVNAQVCGYALR